MASHPIPPSERVHPTSVRLRPGVERRLTSLARIRNTSRSELIRRAVARLLAAEMKTK
jgi:predicted transcriptional regulator